jgi:hypothetical protein
LNRALKTFPAGSLQDAFITNQPRSDGLTGEWRGGENDKDHD